MHYQTPWHHIILDDFLPSSDLERIQSMLPNHRNGFLMEEEDIQEIKYKFLPDLQLAKHLMSEEFKLKLQNLSGLNLKLNQKSLVQLRLMTPDSPAFPIHIDSQDEDSLICILYLSPNWEKECGGELLLHLDKESQADSAESKAVEPIENRMIIFRSKDNHWHSVNRVQNWLRYTVIMEWLVN